jgi:uncharacterized membrane protein
VTDQATSSRTSPALLAAVPSVVGVIVAFVAAIVQYAAIDGGTTKHLYGLDAFLGLPDVAVSVVFFSLFVALFIGTAAGARFGHALWVAAIVVAAIGGLFELLAVILDFSDVTLVLVLAAIGVLVMSMAGARAAKATRSDARVPAGDRQRVFGVFVVLAGLAGLTAAYNLSVDKVTAILTPDVKLNCSISLLVECGKNLGSWQGSLFGFPNPFIGLGGFAVVVVVGIAVIAGVRFPRWWWVAFSVGVMGAFAFITFLIISSVYVIGTLCVWCALVWIFTIPLFWLTLIRNLKDGNLRVGPRATKFWSSAYTWVPLITLVCYLLIFLIYQVHLNLLSSL